MKTISLLLAKEYEITICQVGKLTSVSLGDLLVCRRVSEARHFLLIGEVDLCLCFANDYLSPSASISILTLRYRSQLKGEISSSQHFVDY